MTDYREHTSRIAKNTLMLYFRMFFMMLLGLFTSRIVLEALGENDFGIYNVVGGVVAMFTIISGSLTTAVTRFITFEMGRGDNAQPNQVYSAAVCVLAVLSVLVILLVEPIGLWFIDNKMTIDPLRIPAARLVLHFSLFAFVVNLMSVPQMASITAHEKMSAYAYIGVLDGILRFCVALLIRRDVSDRLVLYAMLMSLVVLIVRIAYGIYCRLHFPECRLCPVRQKGLFKEMFSFAGWNFIGSASGVARDQGGNILVNLFSGPAVNAARGVAVQLNSVILSFVTNFMTAVNPQITKSYASGEREYMHSLLRKSSRLSFYLLFVLSLPMLLNADFILALWLKDVPQYTAIFVQLFIIYNLCESISYPLVTAMLATGKIRNYQIVVGGLQLLNLPVSYILLRIGYPPEVTVVVAIAVSQICLAARLFMLKDMIGLSAKAYLSRVYFNVIKVAAVASAVAILVVSWLPEGTLYSCISIAVSTLIAGLSCLFVGCTPSERQELMSMVKNRIGNDKDR